MLRSTFGTMWCANFEGDFVLTLLNGLVQFQPILGQFRSFLLHVTCPWSSKGGKPCEFLRIERGPEKVTFWVGIPKLAHSFQKWKKISWKYQILEKSEYCNNPLPPHLRIRNQNADFNERNVIERINHKRVYAELRLRFYRLIKVNLF
jgi:hypothetical protein